MVTSQNGWMVLTTSPPKRQVPDSQVYLSVRPGDAGNILLWVASQFDRRVEDIDQARGMPIDDGAWNYRPISGSSDISNHASATAIDLNWNRHPLGAVGTFAQAQVVVIHQILDETFGAVRWGGDYTGRKDEMHFEINTTAAGVAASWAAMQRNLFDASTPKEIYMPEPLYVPTGFAYDLFGDSRVAPENVLQVPGEWANTASSVPTLGKLSVAIGTLYGAPERKVRLRVEYTQRGGDGKDWTPRIGNKLPIAGSTKTGLFYDLGGDTGHQYDWIEMPDASYGYTFGRVPLTEGDTNDAWSIGVRFFYGVRS